MRPDSSRAKVDAIRVMAYSRESQPSGARLDGLGGGSGEPKHRGVQERLEPLLAGTCPQHRLDVVGDRGVQGTKVQLGKRPSRALPPTGAGPDDVGDRLDHRVDRLG